MVTSRAADSPSTDREDAAIDVLHVDDEPMVTDLSARILEDEHDAITVTTATSVDEGRAVLEANTFDCVVSDYEMPATNGIDFLETVRAEYGDLPFILFTGKGSEAIASEAISAGVTEYLQKGGGADQYTVLAHRIENAVTQHRTKQQLEQRERDLADRTHTLQAVLEASPLPILATDRNGVVEWWNDAAEAWFGWTAADVVGEELPIVPEDDRETFERRCEQVLDGASYTDVRVERRTNDGDRRELSLSASPLHDAAGDVVGVMSVYSEVAATERRLETLLETTRTLLATDDRTEICAHLLRAVTDGLGYSIAGCWLHDPEAETLDPMAMTDDARGLFDDPPTYTPDDRSLSWDAFATGETRHYDDLSSVAGTSNPETPVRSEMILPVGDHGVLNIGSRDVGRFDESDVALAKLLVANADAALDLVDRTTELETSRDAAQRMERALAAEQTFIEQALDAMEDIFYVFDEDGQPLRWNDQLTAVTGYSDDEIETMSPVDFFAGEDRNRVLGAIDDVYETGHATVEAELVTADGEAIPYELTGARLHGPDGETNGFVGIARDITARRAAQQRLEASQRSLQRLYRITSNADLDLEAKLEQVIELGCDRLGVELGFLTRIEDGEQRIESSTGDHPLLQPGESCPLDEAYCRKTLETDGLLGIHNAIEAGWAGDPAYEVFELDCYIGGEVRVDGECYGTLCFADTVSRAEPFSDAERTFVELLTLWLSYELDREQVTEQLRAQNDRLEAFASLVSHDLRNPLNVMQGSLASVDPDDDTDREHVARAERAAERMETLIADLLTIARTGGTVDEPEPTDLADLVATCWDAIDHGDNTLTVDTDCTIVADRPRLRQLLENLFRNAVEHGSTGNRTQSGDAAEHAGDDVTVTVGDLPDGFYIEDDGVGIDAADREQVFESGYSTLTDGTGLGLHIVAEVVDAHDWTMTLTESEAGGARFEITGVEFA
jgi:PAS domain S-box-containing protein